MRLLFSPAAFKTLLSIAAGLVLAATPCGAETAGTKLDCHLGYDALLKQLKEQPDIQADDYPFGIEFHKKGTETAAYYFTKPVHAAHPAIFWYGKGSACRTIKADGCGFGGGGKFKDALGKYRARSGNGC
jgi:hypothetical protein